MKKTLAVAAMLSLSATAQQALAADTTEADKAAAVLAEQVCSVCHGPGGHSPSGEAPNLAAQTRQYLAAKLKMFRNRANKNDTHIDILGLNLSDDPMLDALARYYASQSPPPPVTGDASVIATGSKLYARGAPEQKLAPCGVCHGPNGAGLWIFPRLAGQHAEYVERQLKLIQEQLRDSRVMHGIIKGMTPEEIAAVAAFVQSK